MKNFTLLTVFMLTGAMAIAQNPKVINDPNAQKRTVGSFHGIAMHSGIDLYLSQGGDEAVAVSASDPEDRGRIVTEVKDGILQIYMEDRGLHWGWHDRKLKAYVSCKMLDDLEASGGSDVYIDQTVKSDRLEIQLSGGSDLRGKFQVAVMSVGQSGGADAFISGTADKLDVHVSGGSDFHGYELIVDNCQARASGGGDVYVTVNKALDAHASGGADIHYKGNGSVTADHSGGGSVSRRD